MTLKVGIQADVDGAISSLNKLKRALGEVGAAGKSLNEVGKQFSGDAYKKLGGVADHFDQVSDNFHAMRRDAEMRRVTSMAARHGFKQDDPLSYVEHIAGFYANKQKGQALQSKFALNLANGPGAGSVIDGANMAAQMGGGGSGGDSGGSGSNGAFIARNLKWAAGGMLGLAGINSVRQIIGSGMNDTEALRNSSESIFKRVGTVDSFQQLEVELKQLSEALQLSSVETAKLADDFIKASGATGNYREQMARSVTFGRGLGMDPGISSRLFAQASLSGYGTDKSSQREFAALLAHTIASSHLFARSEQIMEDMVGHIGEVASREGRTASTSEMGAYGSILGALYKNPAMAGGGGQSFMQGLKGLGTGGGIDKEMFAWQAFGGWANNDFVNMQAIQDASLFATRKDIFGSGDDETTKLEQMWPEVLRQANFIPGKSGQDKKIAFVLKQLTGMNMGLGESGVRLLNGGMGHFKEFKGWSEAATRMKLDDINPESFGELARLYENRDMASWRSIAGQYTAGGKVSGKDLESLQKAIDSKDDNALREILPAIVARTGAPETPAEADREAKVSLERAIQNLVEPMTDLKTTIQTFLNRLLPGNADATSPILNDLADWVFGEGRSPSDAWSDIKKNLFGGGIPGISDAGASADITRYHNGGIAGLRPGEVPAILEQGEIILPTYLTDAQKKIRGLRNNNPGNMDRIKGRPWEGEVPGADSRFASFATAEHGLRAGAKNIIAKKRRGVKTLKDLLYIYAPPHENDTEAYIKKVSEATGIDPATEIDLANRDVLLKLLPAIIQHENGMQPYPQDAITAGVDAALGLKDLPLPSASSPLRTVTRGRAGRPDYQRPGIAGKSDGYALPSNVRLTDRAAQRGLSGVDPLVVQSILAAAGKYPGRVDIFSSTRPKILANGKRDKGNHSAGYAIDYRLYDANGNVLPEHNDPLPKWHGGGSKYAHIYERFAQDAAAWGEHVSPGFADEVRWGGNFGEGDWQHFDRMRKFGRGAALGDLKHGRKLALGGQSSPLIGGDWESHYAAVYGDQAPKTPTEADRAVRDATTQAQANARVDGQHTLDIVLRNSEGKMFYTRKGMALSEPKVFGSDGERKVWNDTAIMPSGI
jgi:hypothetical protein